MFNKHDYVVIHSHVHKELNGRVGRVVSGWNYGGVGVGEHWVYRVGVLEYPEMSFRSHEGHLKSAQKHKIIIGHIRAIWKRSWLKKRVINEVKVKKLSSFLGKMFSFMGTILVG